MKCKSLDQAKFDDEMARLEKLPLLAPGGPAAPVVRFQFNLTPIPDSGSLFVIQSARIRKAVYRGPYSQEIMLPFTESLLADKGYDQLRFSLIHAGTRLRFCEWANDREAPYWQDRANIQIEFLKHTETDETGLRRAFKAIVA